MKYNDLRDYHNEKFIVDRLSEALGVYGSTVLAYCSLFMNLPIMSALLLFDMAIYDYNFFMENIIGVQRELNLINKNETLILRKNIYVDILKNIKSRFEDGLVADPVTINKYICHIINKGYLSINKKFTIKNVTDLNYNFAYNIIRGSGVCRNVAYMTTDIFNCLGFEAYDLVLYNYFEKNKMHAITMVVYDEKLYFFDNLNRCNYDKVGIVLHSKDSAFYLPVFYLDKCDDVYIGLSQIYKNRCSFEHVKTIYEKFKQANKLSYNLVDSPKSLKKIYTDNKKRYKEFIKTYY